MQGKMNPRALKRRDEGALPVVGAALAMAEGTAGVRSASGADKATVAAPEALGPGAYDGAGGGGVQ